MKQMKSTLIVLALCAFGAGASAQTVSVADVEALPGETVAFTVDLNGGKADTYIAMQFDVQFPETGFTTTGDYSVSPLWKNATSVVGSVDNHGVATIPVSSTEAISAADVEGLLTVAFAVDSNVPLGDYEVTLKNIWFGYGTSSKDYLEDVTFTVHIVDVRTVVLDENSTTAPEAAEAVNVHVLRSINANVWSTICLPFEMTEAQTQEAFGSDVQLGDFTGYETEEDDNENIVGIKVNFESASAIEANHPYIIKVSAPVTEFTVEGVDIAPEEEPTKAAVKRTKKQWSEMIGTYAAETTVEEQMLVLSGGKFWYSVGLTKMKAFRAYFDFYDVLTEVEDASVKVLIDLDDEETGLDGIASPQSENGRWFDISGRNVAKPSQRGIYIQKGKKILVK